MKRILIIGCGRSGTRYTAKVLSAAGLKIGHEVPGDDGMVSWRSVGVREELESHRVILHQVRHPLNVIASFHTAMESSWEYVSQVESRIPLSDPILLRCMKYWLYWNKRCEFAATRTFQVERLMDELLAIFKDIGHTRIINIEMLAIPKNDHTRKQGHKVSESYPVVTWEDLEKTDMGIANQIFELASTFGYDL